ncbi:MAG: indole-3-glycerol phosphate synthase TrpC [Candidatus Latescibacteria bacterium]|nr:indole-3-glycerol phosphate synthase TrpC [Candidatus Latescibacterota bacterium]
MSFLDAIQSEKRREVVSKRAAMSFDDLRTRVQDVAPARDFHAAVARRGAVIAELKARTPTIESFTQSGSLVELAAVYASNGAAAISIVADPARFGTSYRDVARVRDAVNLPVLAKDFVVDPYQLLEARASGADAVLLIVRLLELEELRNLVAFARELGMEALVETHAESEVLAALAADARVVGINNRDLDTMIVSLDTTRRLAHLVPEEIVLVSESGIVTRDDVADLTSRGARAFLVGGSLLGSEDPGALLRDFVEAARGPSGLRSKRVPR